VRPDLTPPKHPGKVKGWLEEDDPFFAIIEEIVDARFQHHPRCIGARNSRAAT